VIFILGIFAISAFNHGYSIFLDDLPEQSKAPYHLKIIKGKNIIGYAKPLYTSLDNPSNHTVPSTNPHDGVAKLLLLTTDGPFGCTGTLAATKIHVLTAAHCVTDGTGNYTLVSGSATFEGDSESVTISINATESVVHPDYDGDFLRGNDIAILKLTEVAPSQIPGIPYALSGNATGSIVNKTGYGLSGFFINGTNITTYPFGTQREGQNKYDALADTMYNALNLTANVDYIPGAIYQFDSDDGTPEHDAFDFFFGISDTGLGTDEVMSAPGDSGGPTFLNGTLVGITSYGITLELLNHFTSDCTSDIPSPKLDSSCGEFAADTRVASYSDFIDSVLNADPDSDGDGISDTNDNCPETPNADQLDTDSDGIGDICDQFPNDPDNDIDGDGISGDIDNCPEISNSTQDDIDSDLIGNECDPQTIISTDTLLDSNASLGGDLIVESGSLLTIAPGVSLDVDFVNHYVMVKFGGGILIKSGATLT